MYLQAIVRDISERKRLEQEHLKTQKLEAIGTLAGGIAHDFNNLLQGVFGYISLAKLRNNDREKMLAALEEAEKALHLSVKLTNQLLTFSKGGKPVKKTIDLLPVIENATKFALSGSRTDYRVAVDEGLWQVDADEGQISQVIQNIVLNADQAMPVGGRVEITARNVHIPVPDAPQGLEKGRYVEIVFRDTGIGIPGKYIGKIFDPYFTTKEKGSGLGLATSYSIIKNHNGTIDVMSEMGKGTTFRIHLPATAAAKREEQARPVAAEHGRTGRVLIMDDEPVILDVAGELIRALGHSAEFSSHGKETIAKYREAQLSGRPFDVVILDLTIRGGMGGAETLRILSEIDPGVKAVVSSGYSDDAAIAGYGEQGFKAVLKKPYHVDELRTVLNRLLNS
jgi:nitrogen-specific signal transduction histidine kinase/CheY-like chemotaxis protein